MKQEIHEGTIWRTNFRTYELTGLLARRGGVAQSQQMSVMIHWISGWNFGGRKCLDIWIHGERTGSMLIDVFDLTIEGENGCS